LNLRVRPLLALTIGLLIASPAGARTTTYSVFNELSRNIRSTLQSASPYLFQVIRTQGDSTADSGRLIGTGVAIGDGHVLTSAGVVGPATEVWVTQDGKDMRRARVLGVDRRTDLAVIDVEGLNTPGIPVASTSLIFPGHPVVAAGRGSRPGLTSTFGVVIVTGGPRLGFTETDVLQVSAPAFPGIAGGALLDMNGQLVGVVSGRLAFSPEDVVLPPGMDLVAGTFEDGRFTTVAPNSATIAVPATLALEIAHELTTRGSVERGYLGLQVDLIQAPTKKAQTLPGVLVHRVVPGSPAEQAGLIPGDVILEYASTRVQGPENLSYLVGATLPGSDVSMLVLRRGVKNVTTVRIEQAPEPDWDPAMDEAIATFSGEAGVAPTVR
jgi:serine protease Do